MTALSETTCTTCGTTAAPGWEFCGGCGGRLAPAAPSPDAAPPPAPDSAGPPDNVVPMWPTTTATVADAPVASPSPAPSLGATASWDAPAATAAYDILPGPVVPAAAPPTPRVTQALRRRRPRWLVPVAAAAALIVVGVAVANDLGVRSRLDDTRSTLRSVQASLAATTTNLESTTAKLATSDASLAATTTERNALKVDLDAKAAELGGVKGTLSDAKSRIDLQAGQIETLKSCLNGVSNALSYAADDDFVSALAALRAVEVSCDRAAEMF